MLPRYWMQFVVTAMLSCACHGVLAGSVPKPSQIDPRQLESCLRAKAQEEGFSGAISIVQNDKLIASITMGTRGEPSDAPITSDTRFNLGSASKMFTAVAVGQLIDGGKIRLDDAVGRYVGGLTPEAARVTVRQLLTHSSGLGDFFKPQNMATMIKARTASDLLPLIASDKPAFAPGSKFAYSNSGLALLGILIERVSGETYGDYLRKHVFVPAGMTSTGLDPNPLSTLAIGMTAHQPGPRSGSPQLIVSPKPDAASKGAIDDTHSGVAATAPKELHPAPGAREGYGSPAGGMFSTVADMQRFASALQRNVLTSAKMTAALTSPQIVAAPASAGQPQKDYGFGFGVGTEAGTKWFGHNGGTLGANAEFAVFPEQQLTAVVLANLDPPVATTMFKYTKQMLFHPNALTTCIRTARNAP